MTETIEIHVIADSTGESAVRIARAARAQFPQANFEIVRHPRVGRTEAMLKALETLKERANHPIAVFFTLVNDELRSLVINACRDLDLPYVDLMGDALRALEKVSGLPADQVAMRPVGVEADYFVRISAMEFAVRNDDGAIPEALRECDICLIGASRSGKTPLSIYLGYLGYKAVNVPLVPGIEPPAELFGVDRWRIVGLTIDAERLLSIRNRRVKGLGGFGTKDGYADLVKIYDELDEVGRIQRKLGAPIVDTTGLALEEAAARVIDIVDERARRAGAQLRRPAGQLKIKP
ncbi:MAG: pyruvate, water dikinase regulatory protein [Propionibacteriaceae bacterium]|nr:pyruvate, water dikinase regulatory protein [Propionibacteriaceae bacterium]